MTIQRELMQSPSVARPRALELAEKIARPVLRLGGFSSTYVPTELGRMHASVARGRGSLPPVILLHGLGAAATNFVPLTLALQPHVQSIICIDMPGHGLSAVTQRSVDLVEMYDALCVCIDALCGMPFSLVGNSLGGAMALRYASERPKRVRSLALLSPAGAALSPDVIRRVTAAFDISTPREARAFLKRVYHQPPWYSALVAREVLAITRSSSVRSVLAQAERASAMEPEELRALAMPVLLWWGESERVLPLEALEYFQAHLPASAVIERPLKMGHCPHVEAPRRTAARLVSHWRAAALNK